VGGQISTQGTSALDERPTQRAVAAPILHQWESGLSASTESTWQRWVSESCFSPRDGHQI